ncbi:hypothetical protein MalM25_12410 [Planctomycetes bacterium MalM25]|nr:hypothetical protein MalM25_12410 [Planctomycetes bacterium MalM25]
MKEPDFIAQTLKMMRLEQSRITFDIKMLFADCCFSSLIKPFNV